MSRELIGVSKTNSMRIDPDKLGAPGVRGSLTVLAIREHETRLEAVRLDDSATRSFTVSALLAKHPSAAGDISGDFTAADGASYLAVPAGRDHLIVSIPAAKFRIDKNNVGELSMITMDLEADGAGSAYAKFYSAISPVLDHFAYGANVPLFLSTVRIKDNRNDVQILDYVSPFRSVAIDTHNASFEVEMTPVYSMYREARSATSVYYQLLCYYKIIEGLAKMKAAAFKRAKKQGLTISFDPELLPAHKDLAPEFGAYIGKSIKSFYDGVLTHRFRDSVAHFTLKTGAVLHVSSATELISFAKAVFACELCVRVLIANHERLLAALSRESGTIGSETQR